MSNKEDIENKTLLSNYIETVIAWHNIFSFVFLATRPDFARVQCWY
jgi:hypothetical protein